MVCLTSINDCWRELKLDVLFAPDEVELNRNKRKSQGAIEDMNMDAVNKDNFEDERIESPNEEETQSEKTESKFNTE